MLGIDAIGKSGANETERMSDSEKSQLMVVTDLDNPPVVCPRGVCAHLKRNKVLYTILFFWLLMLVLLLIFSEHIIDPTLDFMDDQDVETGNFNYILAAVSCVFIIYAPQPLTLLSIWCGVVCYYWRGWGLLISAFGMGLGLFYIHVYTSVCCSKDCQTRCVDRCFANQRAQFKTFERALEEQPFIMGVLMQFSPFQTQLILLLVISITECDLKWYLLGTLLGGFVSISPIMIVGIFADNLSDALKPDGDDPLASAMMIIGFCLMLIGFLYITFWARSLLVYYREEQIIEELTTDVLSSMGKSKLTKSHREKIRKQISERGTISAGDRESLKRQMQDTFTSPSYSTFEKEEAGTFNDRL